MSHACWFQCQCLERFSRGTLSNPDIGFSYPGNCFLLLLRANLPLFPLLPKFPHNRLGLVTDFGNVLLVFVIVPHLLLLMKLLVPEQLLLRDVE